MRSFLAHPGLMSTVVLATSLMALSPACSRANSSGSAPSAAVSAAPVGASSAPSATASAAASASAPAVEASGPSAELTGDHYALTVALAVPSATPGSTTLTVEVRGTDGFHVNELYPHALALTATNATAPANVRRGEAAEVSQQRAAFRVPVEVTAAGATVRGTARFAVCSAENCVPMQRDFAVALR